MSKKENDNNESEVPNELRAGFVHDFISGRPVKATPEEMEAVQVFARRLVEDYGYPKSHIQTRPQYRVRKFPSDEEKTYPVDIAVFNSEKTIEDNLFMVVECKKKNRKDGVAQLKLYLDMSCAEVGVWYNGNEHEYLRKIHHKDGSRTYITLPNIPRCGQRIEDIGLYKRKDLKKPSNLKAIFRDLRNHLAGMTTGITLDAALAQEIINILFCKILDEQETEPNDTINFRAGVGEEPAIIQKRILELFRRVKNATYEDVFASNDTISLDADSLCYVVGELQNYCVMDADRDAIGDAFEVFIGPALRGAEGQFFTPRNVVKMMVDIIDPKPGERIIDPACGSGGFLIVALEHVWQELRRQSNVKGWTEKQLYKREVEVATECFRGIDKDAFLAKVCKAYMALVGDGRGGVFCENSLNHPEDWNAIMLHKIGLGTFDVVLTNPPFGARIPVKGKHLLAQYDLGHRWVVESSGSFALTNKIKDSESPQILFIERCIQLLKPKGRMGIILPEGILGNRGMGYVLDFIRSQGKILGIVDCTRHMFQPHTDTKTNVIFFQKHDLNISKTSDDELFLSVCKTCGHDKRGQLIYRPDGTPDDEISVVAHALRNYSSESVSRLSFRLPQSQMKRYYLVPRYYSPESQTVLDNFVNGTKANLVSIEQLIKLGKLRIGKGHEIGSKAYGTGDIPFIRTSDIANLEITYDPTFAVSRDIYAEYAPKQRLHAGDILFVNDGRYRIGNVCLLTEYDTQIVIQSHFRIIRSLDHTNYDPFLLLFLFRHPAVRLQIESKTFIQSTIATLGNRLKEINLPIPTDAEQIVNVITTLRRNITERARMRMELRYLDSESGFLM
ncbi:MAG: N-6 DNA methylase [Candidatus Hydrogenedentes bacterium]|nr:N-6 DNA methylase [Candidatus Hydrogenedentota bacterium]